MTVHSLDLPEALTLLDLEDLPEDFGELSRQVAWHQPATQPWGESETQAYRVVWEAVEQHVEHPDESLSG
ncbi:hypothetical protein FQK07_06960 [Synechococcus sp. BSF8S]|uniref:hypothetical protein n=1 Tax=Synechococcales TaxID=1890424 RepID=UPI0016259240|nr:MULTISPECIES: hypothetical protein [unclassified Synechococcus]MBC1261017.1 hypothetical protein [Synechococcus sp. BSF8S]MBC1263920.1 hypothetical protein [Synechococcus sp. BSA11S]